jgi:hypothetical protein
LGAAAREGVHVVLVIPQQDLISLIWQTVSTLFSWGGSPEINSWLGKLGIQLVFKGGGCASLTVRCGGDTGLQWQQPPVSLLLSSDVLHC